jgi:23S rRNA (cytosine1962-C5)-methyltransferase
MARACALTGVIDIEALANRVAKNQRHLGRWAQREGIEAYRLYDRDLPEFPLAIDRYADWLHIQVFEKRRPFADEQLTAMREALAARLAVPRAQAVLKLRRRQHGRSQYERLDLGMPSFTVHEHGLRFEVNLGRYLDTGLFLDHRETRQQVREQARDRRFLNLFAYTGSFTVYAAAGGARQTVTVDMSRTYQAWTRRNLVHSGLQDDARHKLVQADVLGFLDRVAAARALFDLVVLDPPSFSNSKRMRDAFDVQRDHLALLRATARVLAPGGVLYFSNNRRGFRLDPAVSDLGEVEDISQQTLTFDFRRQPAHRCWRITAR